jgi:hypothetical protein
VSMTNYPFVGYVVHGTFNRLSSVSSYVCQLFSKFQIGVMILLSFTVT